MKLPKGRYARVERAKVVNYLLSQSHSDGRSKAAFFLSFGFAQKQWRTLAEALRIHGATNEIAGMETSDYGTRYMVDGIIETPDGRNPWIRTVWISDNLNAEPRLVTAHPRRRPQDAQGT